MKQLKRKHIQKTQMIPIPNEFEISRCIENNNENIEGSMKFNLNDILKYTEDNMTIETMMNFFNSYTEMEVIEEVDLGDVKIVKIKMFKNEIIYKPKLEPNKIESNIISKENEVYRNGIEIIRNIKSSISQTKILNQNVFQNIIQRMGRTRKRKKKKCLIKKSRDETIPTIELNFLNEGEQDFGYKWNKRRKKKKRFWDKYWRKMISNFKRCTKKQFEEDKKGKYIFRKMKKERWKTKEFRIRNCYIQKNHVNYCLNLLNISREVWKRKWRQKILQKKKMLLRSKK
jgi:hypothetical protein